MPDKARFVIDRGLIPGEDPSIELGKLQEIVATCKENGTLNSNTKIIVSQRKRPTPPCKPYFFSPDLPAIHTVSKVIKSLGHSVSYGIGRSVADENRVAELGIPTIILGPYGEGSHTSNEWVNLENIKRVADIYKVVLESDLL